MAIIKRIIKAMGDFDWRCVACNQWNESKYRVCQHCGKWN